MGQQIFDSDGTFTVPGGVTELRVSMVGGGGSGARGEPSLSFSWATGGYCGEFICNHIILVAPGQEFSVGVGLGGLAVTSGASYGNPGDSTSFGDLTVVGAPANGVDEFLGVGEPYSSPCGVTYYDGAGYGFSYGAQASIFSDGGAGALEPTIDASPGHLGSGGGGINKAVDPAISGAGGKGRVVVNWDDFVEDGGLLINGTLIPEANGELHFYCKDQLGNDFDGAVQELMLDGQLVWKEI